jgi:HAD superfamily hydrolase (TIGR01549 family)
MRFVIFDMDGVLVDTCGCHARAYEDLWERCGIEGPPYADISGRPTTETVAELTRPLNPSPDTLREWVKFKQERAREYLRDETVVFEDTAPSLAALERAGIGSGVATGASRETARILLERAGIARYFDFVIAAEDVRNGKPHPEIYRRALNLSGVTEREALVVEDAMSGIAAAVAASIPVACVRSGLQVESPLFVGSFPGLTEWTAAMGVKTA